MCYFTWKLELVSNILWMIVGHTCTGWSWVVCRHHYNFWNLRIIITVFYYYFLLFLIFYLFFYLFIYLFIYFILYLFIYYYYYYYYSVFVFLLLSLLYYTYIIKTCQAIGLFFLNDKFQFDFYLLEKEEILLLRFYY